MAADIFYTISDPGQRRQRPHITIGFLFLCNIIQSIGEQTCIGAFIILQQI
jgi:hypothetical protein